MIHKWHKIVTRCYRAVHQTHRSSAIVWTVQDLSHWVTLSFG